jgi:hypothetical protein
MILLNEVAEKLQKILNGTDSETASFSRATDFQFVVATQGFHLDNIIAESGKNFIPVFIATMGGRFNPVSNLGQSEVNIPVTFYFPVRFKNDFFALNEYLADCFVGTQLDYGSITGKCVSNISVSQYGEIQDLDLKQFIDWTQNVYRRTIERAEPYMSMTFTLFLNGSGTFTKNNETYRYLYGNEAKVTISFTYPSAFVYNGVTYNKIDGITTYKGLTYTRWTNSDATSYVLTKSTLPKAEDTVYNTIYQEIGTISSVTTNYIFDDSPAFVNTGVNQSNTPVSQQILGEKETEGLVADSTLSTGFSVYIKTTNFYKKLLQIYASGEISRLSFDLNLTIDEIDFRYNRKCYVSVANLIANKGELMLLTFGFGKEATL